MLPRADLDVGVWLDPQRHLPLFTCRRSANVPEDLGDSVLRWYLRPLRYPGSLAMRVTPACVVDLIAAGHTAPVPRSCGRTLRQLQDIEPGIVLDGVLGGTQAVLVHGDYGPNNMLFDPVTHATTAIVDWEWAHAGDPVEDLAWCEWIIRMHHPEVGDHLQELFDAYGERPSWTRRQDAMLAKCHEMLGLFRPAGAAATGTQRWRRNIEITRPWSARA
jgi:hypothetical protein